MTTTYTIAQLKARGARDAKAGAADVHDAWKNFAGHGNGVGIFGTFKAYGRAKKAFTAGFNKARKQMKKNPARRKAPKGWQSATAVKIVKRGRFTEVLIRKPGKKRAPVKKRAKKKAAAKRRR